MDMLLFAIWMTLLDLAPWLLLGALVAGVMHVLLPANFMKRQFSGTLGIFKAVVLGVPLPLCSCAVIPVGLSIKQSGASTGASVAFLISTPQTGVDSILVSASLLGWPFALFKVFSAAVMGLLGGWWTDREQQISLPVISSAADISGAEPLRWSAFPGHSLELLRAIWRWLMAGVIISAVIATYLPTDALAFPGAGNSVLPMLATLVIALPLYICATASVPIAAALVASGLPVGAALVFLMAGPATNIATIGAVYRALGRRALVVYLTTVVVGSIACGWLFGFLIDTRVVKEVAHVHQTAAWWSTTSAVLLLALIGWFAISEVRQAFGKPSDKSPKSCCGTSDCD